jgi:peptidoglycan-associated lipoprotein
MEITMKYVILALTVLSATACSSTRKEASVAPKQSAVAPQPAKSAEAVADGAKLGAEKSSSTDMFGAKNVDQLVLVHFDYDASTLSEEAQAGLRANADYLRKHADAKIVVEGHCDERGADEYNLALGERRAKAVREYLTLLGIDSSRLETVSYGSEQPLNMASTEEAWAENRRAQFRKLN